MSADLPLSKVDINIKDHIKDDAITKNKIRAEPIYSNYWSLGAGDHENMVDS